jgi:hypothetical protein
LRDAEILRRAAEQELPPTDRPFASTEELVGQVRIGRCSLLLVPSPQMKEARLVDRDALVTGADAPVLFVPRPIDDPAALFKRILHSLPGNFRQTRNFAYSFTLVDDHGEILLLHTIDEDELEGVRQALRVSPDIESQDRQELLETLARHAERYLKGVVAASREMPYEVHYRLTVGQAVAAVEEELARGGFGLLVVGAHQEGYSEVDAEVYQLMHTVQDVPVLAL